MKFALLAGAAIAAALLLTAAPKAADPSIDRILTGSFAEPQTAKTQIRVIDWNIDHGSRLDQIAVAIAKQNADICSLQEADYRARRSGHRNVPEELARRLKLNYVFAPEFQELSQGKRGEPAYIGQAILTRFPVRNVRVIRFETQSNFWQPRLLLPLNGAPLMQRRLGGRMALVAELDYEPGRMLVVYNTHLESRSFGRIQGLQLDEILADAARYPEGTPIVLAGDLNTKYNAEATGERLRQAGWQSAFGDRHPRTHRIMFSLDWVLAKGPVAVEDGRLLRDASGSDHYPISALVALR
jgi:endonuclease/exonuclease/phosphatase family metal-dependent hydrolase